MSEKIGGMPVTGYTVFGHDNTDGELAPLFDTADLAREFMAAHGGDMYPVVDVKIVEATE